jgi:hypothetical protein
LSSTFDVLNEDYPFFYYKQLINFGIIRFSNLKELTKEYFLVEKTEADAPAADTRPPGNGNGGLGKPRNLNNLSLFT